MKAVSRHARFCRPSGFTMTELLVTLGIMALLVAILVPAIQSSREAARGTNCRNRMRQLGMALQNFESRYRQLPMEGGPMVTVAAFSQPIPAQFSVHAQLLNDLEQAPLAAQLNLTQPHHGAWSLEEECGLFRCPSDPGRTKGISYRFCAGTRIRRNPPDADGRGVFSPGEATGLRDLLDGSSQTIAASERNRSDEFPESYDSVVDVIGSGASTLFGSADVSPDDMHDVCRALGGVPALGYSGQVGWYWYRANPLQTHYNHVAPPNSKVTDCTLDSLVSVQGPGSANISVGGQITARSRHPGGVHCLLVDGAVRLMSNTIDLSVWRALATIADQETIGGLD